MAMTQRHYVLLRGAQCPFCTSTDIEGHGSDIESGLTTQEVTCHECGKAWLDIYKLEGYEELS